MNNDNIIDFYRELDDMKHIEERCGRDTEAEMELTLSIQGNEFKYTFTLNDIPKGATDEDIKNLVEESFFKGLLDIDILESLDLKEVKIIN